MNTQKKKVNRRLKCVGEDRISELPDAIIIHILSLLPSTKLCVKTSVLSKRWQNLWTYVPNIILSQFDFPYNEREHHIIDRVVNKTLALHSSLKLNKFSIAIYLDLHKLCPSIESWLQLAVGRAVESLALEFGGSSTRYLLPQFLYSNSNIRSLTTKFCEFVPDGRISWSALKELSIRQATITDQVIQNILDGTPLLEDLQLNFCHGIKLLDLSLNPKLKNLVINVKEFYYGDRGYDFELKIVGPYVETLKLYWSRDNLKCELMNMSSLVKATLDIEVIDDVDDEDGEDDYQEWFPNMLQELVENVLPAEQLQLTNFCTLTLSTLRMDVMASLLSNLKSLNVDCRGEEYLCGIERVLQCSPKLETLVIYFDYGRSSKSKYDGYRKDYWTNAEIPSCLDSHLKTIVISGLIRTRVVVEFLQFLLKNSRVLEKMILRHFNHKYGLILAERLSSYPRSSQKAVFLAA